MTSARNSTVAQELAHHMVNVGIIGLGAAWDARYQPALDKLHQRIRVRAVYDPVASRSEQVAAQFQAVAVDGMLCLTRRADVRAVLLLDTAWYGLVPLRFVVEQGKPAFLGDGLTGNAEELKQLARVADAEGVTLMPGFPLRFMPATSRLLELVATRLGRPEEIQIDAGEPTRLLDIIDWCRYVVDTPPEFLEATPSPGNADASGRQITLGFRQPRKGGTATTVRLHMRRRRDEAEAENSPCPRYAVRCERGRATLKGPDRIAWTTGGEEKTETLSADRSAEEVMLDHFCRRVVGGLIPVADVADVCRALELTRAAEESLRTGRRVSLDPKR